MRSENVIKTLRTRAARTVTVTSQRLRSRSTAHTTSPTAIPPGAPDRLDIQISLRALGIPPEVREHTFPVCNQDQERTRFKSSHKEQAPKSTAQVVPKVFKLVTRLTKAVKTGQNKMCTPLGNR